MRWFTLTALLALLLVLAGCGTVVEFDYPDIKDDFCGVHINFQYCKCAFHNDFCDAIGLDRSAAKVYVQDAYDDWVDGLLEEWLADCAAAGGIAGVDDCEYCDEGFEPRNGECVEVGTAEETDSGDRAAFAPDGPLDAECKVTAQFDDDWRKYSDIDEAIPFNERSYEAKQAVTVYDEMIELMIEGFALERDIEIEAQMQAELEEYRAALVQDLKTNLLKAFWRLSWVTYTTVNSGTSLGESYSQVLTSGAGVETVGAGLKVVQGLIPSDSQLAIDTSTVGGKAASVGANVALEAVDSLGDPTKVATELFKSAANAPLPSADISQEEIDILRDQHISQGVVDKALAESRAANDARRQRVAQIEVEIAGLQEEIDEWEAAEKERVRLGLESSCEDLKKQYEEQE